MSTSRVNHKVAPTLRRRAEGQLERAMAGLHDPGVSLADSIHDMRTSIKKVRAIIRFVRVEAGPKRDREGRRADHRLRKLAHRSAGLRDAEVAVHTWQTLQPGPEFDAIRQILDARLDRQRNLFASDRTIDALTKRLRRARREISRWIPTDGSRWKRIWRAPTNSLAQSYRRARHALSNAQAAADGESFHEWRKSVKSLRYQWQSIQGLWPEDVSTTVQALEGLGELLGQEHDLTMLRMTLDEIATRAPSVAPGIGARPSRAPAIHVGGIPSYGKLKTLMNERQAQLRADALARGRSLFDERPKVFRRRTRARIRKLARPRDVVPPETNATIVASSPSARHQGGHARVLSKDDDDRLDDQPPTGCPPLAGGA